MCECVTVSKMTFVRVLDFFLESQGEEGLVVRWASICIGGREDSLVFTLALIFVRILTLFFYRNPWDVGSEIWGVSIAGVGGGFIDRISLLLLKNIDFNDYSHIYPCKIFFVLFFFLVNFPSHQILAHVFKNNFSFIY